MWSFRYNLVREIPGILGSFVFWIWVTLYITKLWLLPSMKVMGIMYFDDLFFISPPLYNMIIYWIAYGVAAFFGFLLAFFAIKASTFVGLVEVNQQQDGEWWIMYFVLYGMLGCIELNWTTKFLYVVSLCSCGIVCVITQGYAVDRSGFVNVLMTVYFTLLCNKHEEVWMILMVLAVIFYSKVTESVLRRFLLRLGMRDDENLQPQLVHDDEVVDDEVVDNEVVDNEVVHNNNNSVSISIGIGANEHEGNLEGKEEEQRDDIKGETTEGDDGVMEQREQQGQSQ